MVISTVLERSYRRSLTRIDRLFITVITPVMPQEKPWGHASWAQATGTPGLMATGGGGKPCHAARSQPISMSQAASSRRPHLLLSVAEVLPSAGIRMLHRPRELGGAALGSRISAQAAQVRGRAMGHTRPRRGRQRDNGTAATGRKVAWPQGLCYDR